MENEIAQIIKDQKHLELRYNEILQEQEAIRNAQQASSNGNKKVDTQRSRAGKKFSSHSQNASKINAERNGLLSLFGKSIRELRDGRFDALVFTVEEEYRKKDLLQNTINR